MWKEFKPIFFFIAKFFVAYIILTALYSWYLQPYLYDLKIADPITTWMTTASVEMMNLLGYEAEHIQKEGESFRRFILDGKYASSVNEGCNAVAVMIIFASFVIAFSNGIKKTLVFVLLGIFALIVTNIARIGILTYIFRYLPEYSKSAHDYLFPTIIYGMVVILWIVWVQYFAFKK